MEIYDVFSLYLTYLNLGILWFFPYNWVDPHISRVVGLDKKWAGVDRDEVTGSWGRAVEGPNLAYNYI
jgi:hypothetical protein